MRNRNLCQRFYAEGLTYQARSLDCAVRYEPWRGSAVRLLGVSSLNSGRAHARPFFFAPGPLSGQHSVRGNLGQTRNLAVDRREIRARRGKQLGEIVDHEVGLLITVDVVARPHQPAQIKVQPMRVWVLEAIDRCASRGEDPRAV